MNEEALANWGLLCQKQTNNSSKIIIIIISSSSSSGGGGGDGVQLKKVKGRFMGFFQHCDRSAYCILTPNKFPHSSTEAPRIIQMGETSTSEGGNYYQ